MRTDRSLMLLTIGMSQLDWQLVLLARTAQVAAPVRLADAAAQVTSGAAALRMALVAAEVNEQDKAGARHAHVRILEMDVRA